MSARRVWGQLRQRAPRRSCAAGAKCRFLRGLPAGRVAEMLGNERLGQQAQQEMAEDVCPGAAGIFARRSRQTDAALEMLEGNLDAPSQSIESADRRERVLIAVERCDDDDPFGRDQRLGS